MGVAGVQPQEPPVSVLISTSLAGLSHSVDAQAAPLPAARPKS